MASSYIKRILAQAKRPDDAAEHTQEECQILRKQISNRLF